MKKALTILLPIAAILVAGVTGYLLLRDNDSSSPSDADTSQSSSVDSTGSTSQNSQTIEAEELEGALVESFPADEVPLYDGTVTKSLGKMSVSDRPEWNVTIETNDTINQVDAAIRASYAADGWSIRSDGKTLLGGTMLTTQSDGYTVTITYDEIGESGIIINYGVSAK